MGGSSYLFIPAHGLVVSVDEMNHMLDDGISCILQGKRGFRMKKAR